MGKEVEAGFEMGKEVGGGFVMGKEVGGGFGMGDTCTLMADSCQYMARPTTIL